MGPDFHEAYCTKDMAFRRRLSELLVEQGGAALMGGAASSSGYRSGLWTLYGLHEGILFG